MKLRLYHIDGKGCRFVNDIMPGINAVYTMEQEFFPYLDIEFLPHSEFENSGIILQANDELIRRNYTFHDKKELGELRDLIWKYLLKYRKIKDITKNGCLKDFREYNPNRVIQGWRNAKRLAKDDNCCAIILNKLTDEIMARKILHEVYTLSSNDEMDKDTCKKVRFGECGDNYPRGTAQFDRCTREVNWLCNNGYPNKVVKKMDKIVTDVRKKIYDDLKRNNLIVNKQKFDNIIDAGLFADLGNRMGNKVANYKNVNKTLNDIFTEKQYYLGLVEGFDGGSGFGGLMILIIIVLSLFGYFGIVSQFFYS